ncbi:hypothetical protein EJ04DRAFT_458811 [Polyplosphaeria fusca]|uniref:Nudix hydrolase domain-containing protein n=1 Tax=Polyplosphaeria fusca TaxID=682080 RepID=A0A9P4V6Y3_9PLEO|nr:hypothetical protein EJ04DRAFT_458811 [Polyplosphaeria fusca]
MSTNPPQSTFPAHVAQFASQEFVLGAGVAIFHLASARVVICNAPDRHGRKYYFLPKGRRDAGEESGRGAEREGYEESGYRNRLLPLPIKHIQPRAHPRVDNPPMTAEPVWMQMMPMRYGAIQYILYWYIAETIPPEMEKELETKAGDAYKPPSPFPNDLKLRDRIKMEPEGYEPVHHEGTGVDAEEQTYESELLSIEDAVLKLGKNGVQADVILKGWKGIQERSAQEDLVESKKA